MIEIVRRTQRNVKRCRDDEMRLRWTADGMLEAEQQFRRAKGYGAARTRRRAEAELTPTEEVTIVQAA